MSEKPAPRKPVPVKPTKVPLRRPSKVERRPLNPRTEWWTSGPGEVAGAD